MTSTGGFAFGLPQSTQSNPSALGGLSFGQTISTNATPSLTSSAFTSLGANVTGPSGTFGNASTPAATTASSLFTGLSTTPSLTASLTPISSTAAPLFPTLGQTSVTSVPSTGFSFGFGAPTPASTASLGFGTGAALSAPAVATTPTSVSVGLGGVDLSQVSSGPTGGTASGKKDSKAVKETLLPNEIAITLESFKKYVKEQKSVREEMSRVSCKHILKVQEQTAALRQLLAVVSNGLQRNALAIDKLKQESAQELRNAEIAQRTKDTPSALQYENTAPSEYFHNLAVSFEHQMQSYRQQIEQLERHLMSLSQPSALTPNELTLIMCRLHDTFVALAAQLQTVHQAVQSQKEHYLNYQRIIHGDVSNIFKSRKDNIKELLSSSHVPVTVGPAPFSSMPSAAAVAMASALNRTQQPSGNNSTIGVTGIGTSGLGTGLTTGNFLSNQTSGLGSSFGLQSNSTFKPIGQLGISSFGISSLGGAASSLGENSSQTPLAVSNQKPFQLQKPPPGNKRGKRWTST